MNSLFAELIIIAFGSADGKAGLTDIVYVIGQYYVNGSELKEVKDDVLADPESIKYITLLRVDAVSGIVSQVSEITMVKSLLPMTLE